MSRYVCGLVLLVVAAGAFSDGAAVEKAVVNDAAIAGAIDQARSYLWSQWDPQEGHWPEGGDPSAREGEGEFVNYGGRTALCAYALLAAGENHQEARMKRTLGWLREQNLTGNYVLSLRAAAYASIPRPNPYQADLRRDVQTLIQSRTPTNGYGYIDGPGRSVNADNSNSQLALLAVWSASHAGVEVPRDYWDKAEEYWKGQQQPDGGWGYNPTQADSYPSMSAAGLASMLICFEMVHTDRFVDASVDWNYEPTKRGQEWLAKNFTTRSTGPGALWQNYYLYSIERVGMASGLKFLGGKDWYSLCARDLLKEQGKDGAWPASGKGIRELAKGVPAANHDVSTAFALLFLARGRNPILFNKLQYEGTWNCRPRDLANLCEWITGSFEKRVNWQIIDMQADVEDWHDAPILYISGKTPPQFSPADLDKLRLFVQQGGVIFSEAVLNNEAFTADMKEVYAKLFPSFPLTALPEDHPVYNLHFDIKGKKDLLAVSNGCRLLAVHSPREVSRDFQTRAFATRPDTFALIANLYFYVTDRGSLRSRGVSHWPAETAYTPVKTIHLTRLSYEGWLEREELAWNRFALLMANDYHVKVVLSLPTNILNLRYGQDKVAVMSGAGPFTLSDAQRLVLRQFLTDGGTLIVDSAGGGEAFNKSFQEQVLPALPKAQYDFLPTGHELFTLPEMKIDQVTYRRSLREVLHGQKRPRIQAAFLQDRPAILFSSADIHCGLVGYPCWGLMGYDPDSSFKMMRNLVLYAAGKSGAVEQGGTQPAAAAATTEAGTAPAAGK